MKISTTLTRLAGLAGLLALTAAGAGLFWPGGRGSYPFTTLHGEVIEIFGRGLYRHDSLTAAATFLGTDIVTILVMVPLLFYALRRSRQGSLRGGLLLAGALGCLFYNSLHMALAAAYNPLFLLYVAFLSSSLFAFLLAFTAVDLKTLAARASERMPQRGPAVFLFVAGSALALVWLSDLLPAMLQGQPPLALGSSTTTVTYAIDLGVIVPATILAGVLLLRRAPLGILLAAILLVINAIVGLVVIAQTIAMLLLGGPLEAQMVLVFVVPFLLLALVAAWFLASILRRINDSAHQ